MTHAFLTIKQTPLFALFLSFFALIVMFGLPISSSAAEPPPAAAEAKNDHNGGKANPAPKSDNADIGWMAKTASFLGNFLIYLGSYVTWFGGMLLRLSIEYFILNISGLIGNGTPIGIAINTIWTLIRDICNLAFIAGFIYIGIRTIIDADSATTKRALASIIIAAFLINFSLLFAKLIIDIGNTIAVEIYTTTVNGVNIADKFGDILGVTTFYDISSPESQKRHADSSAGGNIAYYFMATIMMVVAGFVLATGAVLLMIRFVALVLILCFSPLLFAATIFPSTASTASDLWKKLINYSLFAPAYLLMLVISIYLLGGVVTAIRGNNTFNGAMNTGNTGAFAVVLSFGIAIFFLIMSLQISQKFGVAGGDKAISIGNSLRGRVQSAVGRNTIGRASASLLKDYEKINAGAKRTRTGRFMGRALKYGSLGVLDDRNIRGTLEGGKKAKFGGQYSHADDVAYGADQKKRQATILKQAKFDATIDNRSDLQRWLGAKAPLSLIGKEPTNETERKQKEDLEKAILSASSKQLEELEQEQRVAMVSMMTQSQIDALNKSDNLTEAEKDEINDARSAVIKKKFGTGGKGEAPLADAQTLRDGLSKANTDELGSLGADFLEQPIHAMRLTSGQMDDLKKKLAPTEFKQVADAREKAFKDLVEGRLSEAAADGKTVENHILKMKASEMSKLPKDVLIKLATQLPASTLAEISRQDTLNVADQKAILDAIIRDQEGEISPPDGVDVDEWKKQRAKHQEAVNKWLNETPAGKHFGV